MSPTLYVHPTSPAVQAVMMTAKYINLELNLQPINSATGETRSPEFLKINPQHTVPTLDDEGFIVWDSHAISDYLVEKYGKDSNLYIHNIQKKATVNQRLFFDDTFFGKLLVAYTRPLTGEPPEQSQLEPIAEAYGFLNTFLEKGKYVAGDALTIADFSMFANISCAELLLPVDKKNYPRVIEWFQKIKALPCSSIVHEGTEMLKEIVRSKDHK